MSTAPRRVRLLRTENAAAYRALMLQAYADTPEAFTSTAEERAAEPLSWWQRRIAAPDGLSAAFGAFDGERLCGTVALEFSAKPKTRHKALLIGMYVEPAARRGGWGHALVSAALGHAHARTEMRVVTLTLTAGNDAALNLYRSCGFQVFGIEPMALRMAEGFRAKMHLWRPLEA